MKMGEGQKERKERKEEEKKARQEDNFKCNLFVVRTSEIEHACSSVLDINTTTEDGVPASIIILSVVVAVTVVAGGETVMGGVEL